MRGSTCDTTRSASGMDLSRDTILYRDHRGGGGGGGATLPVHAATWLVHVATWPVHTATRPMTRPEGPTIRRPVRYDKTPSAWRARGLGTACAQPGSFGVRTVHPT